MKKNPNSGGRRDGSGRGKKTWYESHIAGRVFLDSSYELAYAIWLDSKNVLWRRNWQKFAYEYEGKQSFYIPDFYLIAENKYVEIKGYETEKDKAKWEFFPHNLEVLKEVDLKLKGIL
jgi:hypothetical protein